jgi:hypothetical protein
MPESQFQQWLTHWRLTPDGEAFSTHSSLLLPVQSDGAPAMLKIAMVEEEIRGANLMAWYAGDGAARVLAHEGPALLLERLSGRRSLVEMERSGRGNEATRIICMVVAKLHAARTQTPPETLYPMATWFRQLEPAAKRYGGVLTKCEMAARELLAMPQDVVPLHGDIHHGNILDWGRAWLARYRPERGTRRESLRLRKPLLPPRGHGRQSGRPPRAADRSRGKGSGLGPEASLDLDFGLRGFEVRLDHGKRKRWPGDAGASNRPNGGSRVGALENAARPKIGASFPPF